MQNLLNTVSNTGLLVCKDIFNIYSKLIPIFTYEETDKAGKKLVEPKFS
jgi:hypothetical protein